jgi:hypothetical protein
LSWPPIQNHERVFLLGRQRSVVGSDSDRPELADLFETKAGVPWIGFQELKALVGDSLYGGR